MEQAVPNDWTPHALKSYIDSRFDEVDASLRQRTAQRQDSRAVEASRLHAEIAHVREEAQQGREHLRDVLKTLADERSRAIQVAREETQNVIDMASVEREKAASALRHELERAMIEGDDRLREHITAQYAQVAAALASAEKLELERIARVSTEAQALQVEIDRRFATAIRERDAAEQAMVERVAALRRELQAAQQSAETAVSKAETASEKRFESVNEWRGQSLDRERSSQEAIAKLTGTYMPREVAEAQFNDLRDRIAELRTGSDRGAGASAELARRTSQIHPWMIWIASSSVSIVLSIAVATHGFR